MARDYRTALRAKGIKPIRRPAHTLKKPGDVELLPVRGTYVHGFRDNVVAFTPKEKRLLAALEQMA